MTRRQDVRGGEESTHMRGMLGTEDGVDVCTRCVKLMRCEIELRSGRTDKAGDLWRSILREMGPPDELSLWEHEQQGLVYAGRTLTRLGATALGARCLEIGSREH